MPTLIVLIGPTGVGKTELSLRLAETFQTSIVSADSRQLYAELKIGTSSRKMDKGTDYGTDLSIRCRKGLFLQSHTNLTTLPDTTEK